VYFPVSHAYRVFPDLRHEAQLAHISRKSIDPAGVADRAAEQERINALHKSTRQLLLDKQLASFKEMMKFTEYVDSTEVGAAEEKEDQADDVESPKKHTNTDTDKTTKPLPAKLLSMPQAPCSEQRPPLVQSEIQRSEIDQGMERARLRKLSMDDASNQV